VTPELQLPVVFILGPTASGKTAVACELSLLLDCELISVDSSQVYRRMDIGSAKPSEIELKRFPHALINIREPWETYSVADFCADANSLVAAAQGAGKLPVLVGGTMLYFKAFAEGLATMPAADESVRLRIEAMAEEHGWEGVHARLAEVDPDSAARIHPNDPQRISSSGGFSGQLRKFGLYPADRSQLHQRINQRFDDMLNAGLVEEVKELQRESAMGAELPSQRAVGYRQVWQFLEGSISQQQLSDTGKAATRQLAKRQLTWMRGMPELELHDSFSLSAKELAEHIYASLDLEV